MTDSSEEPTTADRKAGLEMKDAREKAGLSQRSVAAHLGMTQQNYQKYETGNQRMLKSVYDDTIAYCASVILDQTNNPLSGLSEMTQESFSVPLSKDILRQAIEDIKIGLRKLEKLAQM